MIGLEMGAIAELGTPVAMHGSVRSGEVAMDDTFEVIVALVAIVVESAM